MRNYNCEFIGKVVSLEEMPDNIEFYLKVDRPNSSSGRSDTVPFIISRQILGDKVLDVDTTVKLLGVIKTLRVSGSYRSRLRVEVVSIDIVPEDEENKNIVFGRFEVKATKATRTTKNGYKVKDIILKKSISEEIGISEFRAILWNDDADKYSSIGSGTDLYIVGRLQSRDYEKRVSEGVNKYRTYEVSIGKVEDDTDRYAEEVE